MCTHDGSERFLSLMATPPFFSNHRGEDQTAVRLTSETSTYIHAYNIILHYNSITDIHVCIYIYIYIRVYVYVYRYVCIYIYMYHVYVYGRVEFCLTASCPAVQT